MIRIIRMIRFLDYSEFFDLLEPSFQLSFYYFIVFRSSIRRPNYFV